MNESPEYERGKDEVLHYVGAIYVRPIGRGVVLENLENQPHLDDVLDEGEYQAEIRVWKKRRVTAV